MGFAVVLTHDELMTGRAGIFGRWGAKVERFPLDTLSSLRMLPNPSANLLQLEFAGAPPRTLAIMYEPHAVPDFDRIVARLQARLNDRPDGGV